MVAVDYGGCVIDFRLGSERRISSSSTMNLLHNDHQPCHGPRRWHELGVTEWMHTYLELSAPPTWG
jgi:hypothetical protein